MSSQRLILIGDEVITDVIGADPDNDDEDEDGVSDDDENEDNSGSDSDDTDEDEDEDDDDEDELSVDELKEKLAEAQRAKATAEYRMRQADRAKTRAVKKLDQVTKTDNSKKDLLAANTRIEELENKLAENSGADTASLVREEFHELDDYNWHNRKLAFSLLDLEDIEVENGKVDAVSLKDAVEELAKSHPYLLVSGSKKESDEDTDDDETERKPRRSGNQPRKRKKATDREAQIRKYPVLASRK